MIIEITKRGIVLVVEDHGPLYRSPGFCRRQEAGIQVGQQPIAKADRAADITFNNITPGPGVLIDVADLGVVAAERGQDSVLHPAQKQLSVGVALEAADIGTHERLSQIPKPLPIGMLSHKWSQRDWLSPIQFAA